MPLKTIQNEYEAEREIGYRYLQILGRAETLVPGAGREAIDVLLWDAQAAVIRADVQSDRVVLDSTLNCQAVYRQGEESTLRALSAKSGISQVTEIPGAQDGMLCRVLPVVENVEARYENGHMVFLVSIGLHVRVMKLENLKVITAIEDCEGIEARYSEMKLTRLAAEATETAVLTQRVELPRALDARATLMDWGNAVIDSAEPDLGGVRVKGKVQIETLVASGLEGKPAVLVKYPIEFDKLIEIPEWLSNHVCVTPTLRSIRTQLEAPEEDEEGTLMIQVDVHFDICANLSEDVRALEDAYSISDVRLEIEQEEMKLCSEAICLRASETVRGTVLLEENAPAVGSVIAVRVQPNIAELYSAGGRTKINGILEATVLYMPTGSDMAASAHAQMPFEMELNREIGENAAVRISVNSAEANALMSDRLEMKIALNLNAEARIQNEYSIVTDLQLGEKMQKKSGYIICWPGADEDAWTIGKRYAVSEERLLAAGKIENGKPLVIRV